MTGPGDFGQDALQAAFDLHPEAVVVFTGDDLVVAALNDRARHLVGEGGEGGEGVIGRPAHEVLTRIAPALAWETLDRVRRTGESVLTRGWWLPREAADSREDGVHDIQLVPWRGEGTSVRGVIAYGVDAGGPADAMDSARRRRVPPTRAGASGHARREVRLATELQSALLPESLPVLPHLDAAATYVLVDGDIGASGDWFDVVPLPDGTVALVVGDVVGHGLEAATVMGRLRSVLEERLSSGIGLVSAVRALDRYAGSVTAAVGSTVCVVVLDPATGELDYLTAGHPTPLVVGPAGQFRYLPRTGARPLGTTAAGEDAPLLTGHDSLADHELVLLHTDGLVERPGRSLAESTVELGSVAAAAFPLPVESDGEPRSLREMCQSLMEQMVVGEGVTDDATVLVAGTNALPVRFSGTAVADREAALRLRESVDQWLTSLDVRATDRVAIATAVNELVTNAAVHAYDADTRPPGEQTVVVSAELGATGTLRVEVTDRGRWKDPTGSLGGRGLVVAGGITDWLRVQPTATGTTVTIWQRVAREVSLLSRGHVGRLAGLGSSGRTVVEASAGSVTATGSLSADNAFELRAAILRAGRSGVDDVVVDLSRVTFLSSAAVEVLSEMTRRSADHGRWLRLVAPWGTSAQLVLELVGLPYSAA